MTVVNVSLVHVRTVYQDIPLIGKCLCPSKGLNDRASDPQRAPFLTVLVSIGYTAGIFSNNEKKWLLWRSNKVWEVWNLPEKITGRCHLIHNFPWTQKVQHRALSPWRKSLWTQFEEFSLNMNAPALCGVMQWEWIGCTFICVVAENNNKEHLFNIKNKTKQNPNSTMPALKRATIL